MVARFLSLLIIVLSFTLTPNSAFATQVDGQEEMQANGSEVTLGKAELGQKYQMKAFVAKDGTESFGWENGLGNKPEILTVGVLKSIIISVPNQAKILQGIRKILIAQVVAKRLWAELKKEDRINKFNNDYPVRYNAFLKTNPKVSENVPDLIEHIIDHGHLGDFSYYIPYTELSKDVPSEFYYNECIQRSIEMYQSRIQNYRKKNVSKAPSLSDVEYQTLAKLSMQTDVYVKQKFEEAMKKFTYKGGKNEKLLYPKGYEVDPTGCLKIAAETIVDTIFDSNNLYSCWVDDYKEADNGLKIFGKFNRKSAVSEILTNKLIEAKDSKTPYAKIGSYNNISTDTFALGIKVDKNTGMIELMTLFPKIPDQKEKDVSSPSISVSRESSASGLRDDLEQK